MYWYQMRNQWLVVIFLSSFWKKFFPETLNPQPKWSMGWQNHMQKSTWRCWWWHYWLNPSLAVGREWFGCLVGSAQLLSCSLEPAELNWYCLYFIDEEPKTQRSKVAFLDRKAGKSLTEVNRSMSWSGLLSVSDSFSNSILALLAILIKALDLFETAILKKVVVLKYKMKTVL